MNSTGLSVISAAIFTLALTAGALAERYGTFVGHVITQWEDDGRRMTLIEPFQFVDARGQRWKVPRGIAVDGASIPSILWSLIGGPFEGKYRNASIIHDYYCEIRSRRWQDVHRVFYDAMRAAGVTKARALLMFEAVNRFGPRWDKPTIDPKCLKPNGDLDLGKCTRNSAVSKTDIIWPKAGKTELRDFLEDVGHTADPADIRVLQNAIEK